MLKQFIAWIIALIVVLLIGWVNICARTIKVSPEALVDPQMYLIQGNSLVAISPLEFPKIQILASIIQCESGGDYLAKNPKSTAFGLCQIIDSTWLYVQKKWGMELDRHNEYDQLYACERLLREEGLVHWKSSKSCWSK